MAKVPVSHKKFGDEENEKPPKRDPVPPGRYHTLIMKVSTGATKHDTPMSKISVEFQILWGIDDDNPSAHDETHQGRRVYQDFILEDEEAKPDMSEQRRYELRMLLDACDAPFDETGFDTDDLEEKTVIITVRHRQGSTKDDEGHFRIFTNVVKVDSAEPVEDGDII